MFTNPAVCNGQPLQTKLYMDSWKNPGRSSMLMGTPEPEGGGWPSMTYESRPVTGCDLLHFEASMSARPDTDFGYSPTGLDFDLTVPQTEEPGKPILRCSVMRRS